MSNAAAKKKKSQGEEKSTQGKEQGYTGLHLLPQHAQLLADSAISQDVALARGYKSIEKKVELEKLGFGVKQRIVPGLLLPVHNVIGEIPFHQYRPDDPRRNSEGKIIKYETPTATRMAVDIPPGAHQQLGNPKRPLFITEGIRKADSAVSHKMCCIALLGVWNWRGKNEEGGTASLPDWEDIVLKDRDVYIVFDSDVMYKPAVYQALKRLKAFLEKRKARVQVIYLESKPNNGKVGLDDFFASGHVYQQLFHYATDKLKPGPEPDRPYPYKETENGLVYFKPTQNGSVEVPLSNFTARITSDLKEDDGVEVRRLLEVEARQGKRKATIQVPADRFARLDWAVEALGAKAILAPGQMIRDHVRAAVQAFSLDTVVERMQYAHLGWRKINNEWVYLHADGAIGEHGQVEDIETVLPTTLRRYSLPSPPTGEDLIKSIQASLRILDVAPRSITTPILAVTFRAVLGNTDFALHLCGGTGVGKTELVTLGQQHWGLGLDARHLPGSFSSTANALEGLAFAAKDALLVIDDFAPTGSVTDVARMHKDADRLFRGQGNRSGRLRMRADATLKPAKYPRGLLVTTGEDVPRGQSVRARMLNLEVSEGSVDWTKMTACQQDASQGVYANTMSAYLSWLAPQYETIAKQLTQEINALRAEARKDGHARTPGIMASLAVGLRYFLRFAVESEALSEEEREELWGESWDALSDAAIDQAQFQTASEPAGRFIQLVTAAIASGKAHCASKDGQQPDEPSAWGWVQKWSSQSSFNKTAGYEARGDRIGWVDGNDLFLDP